MRALSSLISTISMLALGMNALGGLEEVLQMMSKDGSNEQPDPMPNGYGTVKFPHLVAQSGFAMVGASVMSLLLVAHEHNGTTTRRRQWKRKNRDMVFIGMSTEKRIASSSQ